MDKNILKHWKKNNDLYHKMKSECDIISKVANDLFERSSLRNQLASDISCEYYEGEGVILVFELLDGELPHHILIDDFFNLFTENNLDKITYRTLISFSF